MRIKAATFGKLVGILAASVALSSPALVHADPHYGGGGHAHAEGRGGRGRAVGHAYVGRGYVGHGYVGHDYGGGYAHAYGGARYGAYAGPRAGWGGRGWGGYRAAWGGGWWGGYYWPAAHYGWNYPWFLATLPLGYATYWWGGVPYYYINDVYYSWNPVDAGYVVTDPPPIGSEPAPASDPSAAPAYDPSAGPGYDPSAGPAEDAPPPPPPSNSSGSPDDVYMYPKNGQSAQQQATDRYECHEWAQEQTGFDPTQSAAQSSGNAVDYHRAMVACLQGRGYSVN